VTLGLSTHRACAGVLSRPCLRQIVTSLMCILVLAVAHLSLLGVEAVCLLGGASATAQPLERCNHSRDQVSSSP
jgi:hypothetical protein